MTATEKVSWSLEHDSGDRFRLTNTGDAEAVGVEVVPHESFSVIAPNGGPDLDPGEAMTFIASLDMGTSDTTLTVTWTEPSSREPQKRWHCPLPGR